MCKEQTYFDHAASSQPKPALVVNALGRAASKIQTNPHRSVREENRLDECRSNLADFLNLDSDQVIVYCANATMAANLYLLGTSLAFENRLNIFCDNYGHNALLRPAYFLAQNFKVNVQILKRRGGRAETLLEQLSGINERSIICLAAASNVTGEVLKNDFYVTLAEKLEATGSFLLLDCAQLAGNHPLPPVPGSLPANTAFCLSGHKYLLGPEAIGMLVLHKDSPVQPLITGGVGFDSSSKNMPGELPYRLEAGTYNMMAIEGLDAAIGQGATFYNQVRQSNNRLAKRLATWLNKQPDFELVARFDDLNTPVIGFIHRQLPASELAYILAESFGIISRQGMFCSPQTFDSLPRAFASGALRISFGYSNTEKQLDYLLSALNELT